MKRPMPTKASYPDELDGALETLNKSTLVADTLSDPAARFPSDLAYWFARLYYYITSHEIEGRGAFNHPDFVMHFIPIFYDMYAIEAYRFARKWQKPPSKEEQAILDAAVAVASRGVGPIDVTGVGGLGLEEKQRREPITANWAGHFGIASTPTDPSKPMEWMAYATASISSGVSAHIIGDMPKALEQAYKSYVSKYSGVPPFDAYYKDFFELNRPIFEKVKADLLNELLNRGMGLAAMGRSVDPSLSGKLADKFKIGLNVDEIYKWRDTAWGQAKDNLVRAKLTPR